MFRDWLKNQAASFRKDERGGFSGMFAAILLPSVLVIGSAVDFSSALNTRLGLSSALDAAALVGAAKLVREGRSEAEVAAAVQAMFDASVERVAQGATVSALDIRQDPSLGQVSVSATVSVPTAFMQIARITTIDVNAKSAARLVDKDIEVALMLDVTGSMGGSKIQDLKLAAKDLVDILLPGTSSIYRNKVRIGLVPYSQGVNAGSYASLVTDGKSSRCATERTVANQYNDDPYTTTPIGNGSSGCPYATLLPITDNRTTLRDRINSFSATGWTAGHTGIAWAWYLLSPNWSALWPSGSDPVAYGTKDTEKIAILMTDGEFNTAYNYDSYYRRYVETQGYATTQSQTRAKRLCTEMKAKGITIYSITFQLDNTAAKTMMKECASGTAKYYDAADGNALRVAFKSIAADISPLRISE